MTFCITAPRGRLGQGWQQERGSEAPASCLLPLGSVIGWKFFFFIFLTFIILKAILGARGCAPKEARMSTAVLCWSGDASVTRVDFSIYTDRYRNNYRSVLMHGLLY